MSIPTDKGLNNESLLRIKTTHRPMTAQNVRIKTRHLHHPLKAWRTTQKRRWKECNSQKMGKGVTKYHPSSKYDNVMATITHSNAFTLALGAQMGPPNSQL